MKKHAGSGKIMLIRLDPDLQHCLSIPWVLSFCDWLRKCIRILFVLSNWCAWLSQMAQQHAKMDLFADIVGDDASPEDYLSSYNEQYWALKICCMLLTQIKYVLVCQHCCLLRGWEEQPPGGPVLLPGRRVLQGGHATTTVTFGTLVLGIQYIWIRILKFAPIWIQFRVWILAVSHVYFKNVEETQSLKKIKNKVLN